MERDYRPSAEEEIQWEDLSIPERIQRSLMRDEPIPHHLITNESQQQGTNKEIRDNQDLTRLQEYTAFAMLVQNGEGFVFQNIEDIAVFLFRDHLNTLQESGYKGSYLAGVKGRAIRRVQKARKELIDKYDTSYGQSEESLRSKPCLAALESYISQNPSYSGLPHYEIVRILNR